MKMKGTSTPEPGTRDWTGIALTAVLDQLRSPLLNLPIFLASALLHLKTLFPRGNSLPFVPGIHLFAFNTLFWLSAANEIGRHGVAGKSRSAGDGDYDLASWWFYSPLSLHAFRFLGVGLSFLCITLAPIGYFVYTDQTAVTSAIIVYWYFSFPIVFSMAFVVGRYHALAWTFVPLALSMASQGDHIALAIALAVISLSSSTVFVLVAIQVFCMALLGGGMPIIYATIPGVLLAMGYVAYLFMHSGDGIEKLSSMLKGIGASRTSDVKYVRKRYYRYHPIDYWYLCASAWYLVVSMFAFSSFPFLFLIAISLLIINSRYARFADTQTVQYLVVVVGLFELARYGDSYLAFVAPLFFAGQAFLHKTGVKDFGASLSVVRPADLTPEIEKVRRLFADIPKASKVFIPFADPEGEYGRLYDGYRHCIELPVYVGSEMEINVFPNWPMVFKYIAADSPAFWAADVQDALGACKAWGADYILLNGKEYEYNAADIPGPKIGQYSFDTESFDPWSRKHFKNPDWVLFGPISR